MRKRILDIAELQMRSGGYNALNFGPIAIELSTTRANIHYHFKNKSSLALAVTEAFAAKHSEDFERFAAKHPDDFLSFCQCVEDYFFQMVREKGLSTCVCAQIFNSCDAPQELVDFSNKHFQEIQELIGKVIMQSQKAGNISNRQTPQFLTTRFAIMMMGMRQIAVSFENIMDLEMVLRGHVTEWADSLK
ncbi:TetR/AcrR family transcriptional regulator [bacterium]|nr:TetR/AcrR family transcriptional regulator [bacterium]